MHSRLVGIYVGNISRCRTSSHFLNDAGAVTSMSPNGRAFNKTIRMQLVLLVMFFCSSAEQIIFPTSMMAGVISAVRIHTRSRCVALLYEGIDIKVVISLQKLLSTEHVFLIPLSWSALQSGSCSRMQPLNVMLAAGNLTQSGLNMMSKAGKIHGSAWLLFFNGSSIDSFLKDVYVPLNSEFIVGYNVWSPKTVELTEVYRLRALQPLLKSYWGRWSSTLGLRPPKASLYNRRGNLHGIQLKVADIQDAPYTTISYENGIMKAGGLFNDVLRVLEKQLNFTTVHLEPPDDQYGAQQANGSWNGMIGMLQRGEVDFCVAAMVKTLERTEVIYFSTTVLISQYVMFMRNPGESVAINWSSFMKPFSFNLWLVLLFITLLAALHSQAVSAIQKRYGRDEEFYFSTFHEALFYSFRAIICQQSQEKVPVSFPARISLFFMYITGVTILASYSAALISSIAVRKLELPFTSAEGLLEDGTYQLGVHKQYAIHTMFKEAEKGMMKDLYQKNMKMSEDNFPDNNVKAVQRMCHNDKFAFMALFEEMVQYITHNNCTIVVLPAPFLKVTMSYTLPKNSPYLQLFDLELTKLRNTGIMNKLYRNAWLHSLPKGSDEVESLRIQHVLPIITLLLLGLVLSFLVLAKEQVMSGHTLALIREYRYRKKLKILKTAINPKAYLQR